MGKYNFDKIANRRNIDSIKYREDKSILPMWVADMDFNVLPEIVTAIKDKADRSCFGYVDILDNKRKRGDISNDEYKEKLVKAIKHAKNNNDIYGKNGNGNKNLKLIMDYA